MLAIEQINLVKKEFIFKTSRSGGKGGQNVNKVETKVELMFDLSASLHLTPFQKTILISKLKNRIDENGWLHLVEDKSRSQLVNKEAVVNRCIELLNESLKVKKKRKPTKPTKASQTKRVDSKKRRSDIKQSRRKPL